MQNLIQWLIDILRGIQFWVIILPWERGVRVRWAKHKTVLDPGVYWKIPWVDRVWPINSRLRFTSFPAQTITTRDGKTMTVGGVIGFRITDPVAAMMTFQQPEYSCAALVQASVANYISGRDAVELDKQELESEAVQQLKEATDGITFEFVTVSDWANVRAIRLMQEVWRPETRHDVDPYDK